MASAIQEFREAARVEPTPTKIASKLPQYVQVPNLLASRSLGLRTPLGLTDAFISSIYNSFDAINTPGAAEPEYNHYQGGVFNLEFSLDGGLLVAACEGRQILLYDSGNQRLVHEVENAHYNCVNCIKFLSHNSFATGSDDSLINLWDVRNLRKPTKVLSGHTSWVKNIEWSEREKLMVTTAFDGTIRAWDLNDLDESFDKVFLMKGLMRMKLTPDGTKMVISTTNGYLIIIHDLNLHTLSKDLKAFRPDIYRLMQLGHQVFPGATKYNYLFSPNQKRNRIEFIEDFPNEAEVISSLQIHPYGWSAVTRNINGEENEEWTSVHDIQERDPKDYEEAFEYVEECEIGDESDGQHDPVRDLWMGFVPMAEFHTDNDWHPRPGHGQETNRLHSGLIGLQDPSSENRPEDKNKIVNNLKRLTHYVKEKNVGKSFIKVLAFSPDGRIICSPYGKGMRLLAFSDKCQELSDCVPEEPRELKTVLEVNDYHRDIVVSCRFSPTHYQLVTGCLGSEIKWYQPVL